MVKIDILLTKCTSEENEKSEKFRKNKIIKY